MIQTRGMIPTRGTTASTIDRSAEPVDQRGKRRPPLRTSVIGSYPFPGWLEFATAHLDEFGEADIEEMRTDAVIAAVHDQLRAGLDVITDGEQSRYDFNLSFYGRLEGIRATPYSPRRFGPPAHDQRGKYPITGTILSRHGLGAAAEFKLLQRSPPPAALFSRPACPDPIR
jgi:5-methyltetrahydropteroyltriglutamate--homocysteine methyltransferase